jgi:ADP-dependent NAD(P)H-hydrate dehydratase / NAD(P)H-hydrate epimerase
MKIFRTHQIKEIDDYTIKNEPIASFDLMERAADQLQRWYTRTFDRSGRAVIFAGPGNNGGDGIALARLLSANRFNVEVFFVKASDKTSDDWNINYQRLEKETSVPFNTIESIDHFPFISSDDILIDAIFGSGLSRPVEGLASLVIKKINQTGNVVISIDIPSGLFGEDNISNKPETIVRADHTLSFEFPKLSFMFGENAGFVGEWIVLHIGLSKNAIINTQTPYQYTEDNFVLPLLKNRQKFDHKGKYGHGLLIAGSHGKIGASVLGARAALRTGIGLITCHVPACGYQVIQTSLPEAMAIADKNESIISDSLPLETFNAAAIGPGIGTDQVTQNALHAYLKKCLIPLVIDADGINILGLNKEWLAELPIGTILTPHVKEFERIAGKTENSYQRLERQAEFAAEHNCVVILKGAHTSVATPDGKAYFNSTGNPGMATAGSGDVLTGMILSLIAQGYSPENASVIGVYLHGLAGDIASSKSCYESIIASDIIDNTGNAFLKLRASV